MLIYFKVGNFKSIYDPVVINFEATSISEHVESNVIEKSGTNLLKSVVLYGPNAGGKSKILDAFVLYRRLILTSASHNSTRKLPVQSFRLKVESVANPSFFETEFLLGNKKYRYGFEADTKQIHKEWLLEVKVTRVKPVFLRIGQNFDIDHKKFLNTEGLETKCNENALFLSVADQWAAPLAKDIHRWFHDMYAMHGSIDERYKHHTDNLLYDPEYANLINQLIRHADLGINAVDLEEYSDEEMEKVRKNVGSASIENEERKRNHVYTRHNVYDKDGKIVDETLFNLAIHESEGTKKFYNLIGAILYSVKNGGLVVIDELDARLHTLLTKAIIRLFNSDGVKSGAQLLAACHDTALMNGDLLRRDQIYIVEKDQQSSTKVVNLVEYKNARKDTPFAKNYLEGRYGGIPFIENFENFLKNAEE